MDFSKVIVWVLSDGKKGHENQSIGVAEALGARPQLIFIADKTPKHIAAMKKAPDMIIATGRKAATVALAIKRKFPAVFLVQMMLPLGKFGLKTKPRTWLSRLVGPDFSQFNVIAVPCHEQCYLLPNMVETVGAPNKVTAARLTENGRIWHKQFSVLTSPKLGIIVGGTSKRFRFTPQRARDFATRVALFAKATKASLLVTPSRRTGQRQEQIIREELSGLSGYVWDGRGDNPYHGILAHADGFVVTAESTSMISEACSTGKPVFLYGVDSRCQSRRMGKFNVFYRRLYQEGWIAPLGAPSFQTKHSGLNDARTVADFIRQRYVKR